MQETFYQCFDSPRGEGGSVSGSIRSGRYARSGIWEKNDYLPCLRKGRWVQRGKGIMLLVNLLSYCLRGCLWQNEVLYQEVDTMTQLGYHYGRTGKRKFKGGDLESPRIGPGTDKRVEKPWRTE